MPSRLAILRRAIRVEERELAALFWAFSWFFCVLAGWYVLRPLREEMGVAGGVRNLQWLFTGTFVMMLLAVPAYSGLVARTRRRIFVPFVLHFFAANLLVFWFLFTRLPESATLYLARAYFIWTSVFILFATSVFWSTLADLFTEDQGKRLFGFIAGGGTLGALAGSGLTALVVEHTGTVQLLLAPIVLLELAVLCFFRLVAACQREAGESVFRTVSATDAPTGGGVFAGFGLALRSPYLLGICGYMFFSTLCATFVYFEQASIVEATYDDPAARTRLFASINLAVQAGTIVVQTLLHARLVRRFGIGTVLAALPAFYLLGFTVLGLATSLTVVVVFEVVRRIGNYAVATPTKEILFTVVSREEKYKAKSFIDTVVYRGGDAASGWFFKGLRTLQWSLSGIAFFALPLCAVWVGIAAWLGREERRLASSRTEPE